MIKKWITAAAILLVAFPAVGGEIIGNTYIGEKNGYIEIQSPDGKWQIEDREGRGNQIANFTLKDAIRGARPTMLFFGVPKQGGVTIDQVMQWGREAAEKQGMELGPIETRRFGGKPTLTYTGKLTKGSVQIVMQMFVLEGPKTFFQISATANAAVYETAKPLFEEVMEKLKY